MNNNDKKNPKKNRKVRPTRTAAQKKQRFTQIVVFVMIGTLLLSGLVAGIGSAL